MIVHDMAATTAYIMRLDLANGEVDLWLVAPSVSIAEACAAKERTDLCNAGFAFYVIRAPLNKM